MFASIYCVLYLHLALNLWLHAEFHIPYGSHSRLKKCFPACLFTNEKRWVFFELGNQIMIFLGDFSHFQFFWVYQNVTFEFLFVAYKLLAPAKGESPQIWKRCLELLNYTFAIPRFFSIETPWGVVGDLCIFMYIHHVPRFFQWNTFGFGSYSELIWTTNFHQILVHRMCLSSSFPTKVISITSSLRKWLGSFGKVG